MCDVNKIHEFMLVLIISYYETSTIIITITTETTLIFLQATTSNLKSMSCTSSLVNVAHMGFILNQ